MTSKITALPGRLDENIKKTMEDDDQVLHKSKTYHASQDVDDQLDSRQIRDSEDLSGVSSGLYKEPPIEFDDMAKLVDLNTRLSKSIRTMALNTVGLGWNVKIKDGVKQNDEEFEVAKQQKEAVENVLNLPNFNKNFSTLMKVMKIDEESTGNGYIEVVRSLDGSIKRLYNIPATEIVVRDEPENGFIQRSDSTGEDVYFKRFGDPREMDAQTGDFVEDSEFDELPAERKATELIQFKIYNTQNSYYGIPRWMPAIPAVAGNRKAAERNVNFFDNDGVPRMIVMVEGGSLSERSDKEIRDFLRREHKGVENSHRVMVLESVNQDSNNPSPLSDGANSNAEIRIEPLTVGLEEDASFLEYRKANDEEIREAFGISQAFFNTAEVNRSSAESGRAITNEQEFEPDRKEKEHILNHHIIRDIAIRETVDNPEKIEDKDIREINDVDVHVELEFEAPTIGNPEKDEAEILSQYSEIAALTVNEIRERIGKDPFPDEFDFAQKPLKVAIAELNAGIKAPISGATTVGDTDPEDTEGITDGQSVGNQDQNSNRGKSQDSDPDQNGSGDEQQAIRNFTGDLSNLDNDTEIENVLKIAEVIVNNDKSDVEELLNKSEEVS